MLAPGALAPFIHAPALGGSASYAVDTAAGRPLLLLFAGSAGWPASARALELLPRHRDLFDDVRAAFFGISSDPEDVAQGRIQSQPPGIRWLLDYNGDVARAYGAIRPSSDGSAERRYVPHWLLLDRTMRVVRTAPIDQGEQIVAELSAALRCEASATPAPVLVLPRVFEPALCRRLIELHSADGGTDSGFMREENGITVGRLDYRHKRRTDCEITDPDLRQAIGMQLQRSLLPMIRRVFQFEATRIERWLVACYDGDHGGHFRAHRDDTTKGTAHRRFACTINLNAEEYDGGDLRFPEYGTATYRAPTGGAVVFSCALLHEALPVTRGLRYAFLPFFYDNAAALVRQRNTEYVTGTLASYRADPTSVVPEA